MPENSLRGDRFVLDLPAVVVGNHRHGGEGDLCLPRQSGFGQIRHANYIKAMAAVQFGLRPRGKSRAIHIHVGATVMNSRPPPSGLRSVARKLVLIGSAKKMSGRSRLKKGVARPQAGAVVKLRRQEDVARRISS